MLFTKGMQTLRSKPPAVGIYSSSTDASATYVGLIMATVFAPHQLIGGPELMAPRPVFLKRSHTDRSAAHRREAGLLQYLSRPGDRAQNFIIKLRKVYSLGEHNYIAMEQGGWNLTVLVE